MKWTRVFAARLPLDGIFKADAQQLSAPCSHGGTILHIVPVHMDIACDKCQRVYFVAISPDRIEVDHSLTGMVLYQLTCAHPCNAIRCFDEGDMKPYSVSLFLTDEGGQVGASIRRFGVPRDVFPSSTAGLWKKKAQSRPIPRAKITRIAPSLF